MFIVLCSFGDCCTYSCTEARGVCDDLASCDVIIQEDIAADEFDSVENYTIDRDGNGYPRYTKNEVEYFIQEIEINKRFCF